MCDCWFTLSQDETQAKHQQGEDEGDWVPKRFSSTGGGGRASVLREMVCRAHTYPRLHTPDCMPRTDVALWFRLVGLWIEKLDTLVLTC